MPKSNLSVLLRASFLVGLEDLRAFYTWKTWTFGWLLRVLFQVLFFTLIGRYLGVPDTVRYLLVGSASAIAVLESMTIVLHTAFDRAQGALPLFVSSPGDYFVMLVARNFIVVVTGTFTALIALPVCALVVGVPLPYPAAFAAIPLIAAGATSVYLFGVFLSALMAKLTVGRWVVLNLGYLGLTAVCGFVVPVGFWPAPLTWLAQVLPFTHALQALRGLLTDGVSIEHVLAQGALELIVAACWFVVGRLAFRASIELARRDGSIDLAPA